MPKANWPLLNRISSLVIGSIGLLGCSGAIYVYRRVEVARPGAPWNLLWVTVAGIGIGGLLLTLVGEFVPRLRGHGVEKVGWVCAVGSLVFPSSVAIFWVV